MTGRVLRPLYAFLAREASHARTPVSALIYRVMAHETAAENETALAALTLAPTDRVLEVGFGHGRTLRLAASRVPHGSVTGIDVSERMLRSAARRNRREIRTGHVTLRAGDVESLPFPDASFEKIFSVHTLYFWRDAERACSELARVLRPRGRLVLAFVPEETRPSPERFPADVYRFRSSDEVMSLLVGAGLREVAIEARTIGTRPLALATATRPV